MSRPLGTGEQMFALSKDGPFFIIRAVERGDKTGIRQLVEVFDDLRARLAAAEEENKTLRDELFRVERAAERHRDNASLRSQCINDLERELEQRAVKDDALRKRLDEAEGLVRGLREALKHTGVAFDFRQCDALLASIAQDRQPMTPEEEVEEAAGRR